MKIFESNKAKLILIIPIIMSIGSFSQFVFIPQYEIRDHEGYLGGAIVLAGYIALILLTNIIKEHMLNSYSKGREYIYILSIVNVLATAVCVKTLLFYYSRLYVLSLAIFVIVPCIYTAAEHVITKMGKTLIIGYMDILCATGVVAILSTIVRGVYITRWQLMITLVVLCVVIFFDVMTAIVRRDDQSYKKYYPYDFLAWKNETRTEFKNRLKITSTIIASLIVLYLFLGPLEIYTGNMLSFSFGYKTFFPLFLLIGIFTLLVMSAVISLLTEKTYKLVCVLLMSFSILSYLQCMVMNTKLMEEDGARLRLDTMGKYPKINLVIWLVILVAIAIISFLIKNRWKTMAVGICAFLSLVQIVAVISLIVTCMNSPAPRYYQLTGDKMFSVANEENVIVLVPDSFCRRYLNELMADNPSCTEMFKDFTYYNNMDSEYHPTFPSFTHFVTGYEGIPGLESGLSKERVQWQKDAWNSDRNLRFVDALKKEGYHYYINIPSACELLGAYEDVYDKVENAEYAESNVDRKLLLKMLFSMSIYRCVPYPVKPPFEYFSWDFAALERYDGKVAAYKNEDFYAEAMEGITVDETIEKKVHIINWHGFHEEYTNDEYCNYVENAESNGVSMLQNGKGVLLCIEKYLEGLKEIDMYDDSTIIVMGDHGKPYDGCVFVKEAKEKHNEMLVDETPRTYGDFQATILDIIGVQNHDDFGATWLD